MEDYQSARLVWDGKNEAITPNKAGTLREIQKVRVNPVWQNEGYYQQLEAPPPATEPLINLFYHGDNYELLNYLVKTDPPQKIDLIYIDPPYMTEVDYYSSISIGTSAGRTIKRAAFRDRWPQGRDSYLHMIYKRLRLMKKVLSPQGSIFVHVDWHVSHYIRVLLDEVFGAENFINEIVWCFGGGSNAQRYFHRKHDLIFWYGCSEDYIFNPQRRPYTAGTVKRGLTRVKGERYKLHAEGALMQDWWTDINKILSPTAYENLKFPTQKPRALLKRIIAAASHPSSLVADFFAGSGTMAEVCDEMDRNWILCDTSALALQTSCYRLIRCGSKPFKIAAPNISRPADNGCDLVLKQPVMNRVSDHSTLVDLGIESYWSVQLKDQPHDGNFADYIEFWEIDLHYRNDIFNSDYQVLRSKYRHKEPIALNILVKLERGRNYRIAVKVWDVWANQTIEVIDIIT